MPTLGFDVAGEWFAWGTTFDDVAQRGIRLQQDPRSATRRVVQAVGRCFGGDYALVELASYAQDRPIWSVSYQVPRSTWMDHIETITDAHGRLVTTLGPPTRGQGEARQLKRAHFGEVILYAVWQEAQAHWGVSWYGDVRHEHGHAISGSIYIGWDDVLAAAKPYLPSYRSQQQALGQLTVASVVAKLAQPKRAQPSPPQVIQAPSKPIEDRALTEARRALSRSALCFTTPALVQALGLHDGTSSQTELVVWRSVAGHLAASTAPTTLVTAPGTPLPLQWTHLKPAKGGGGNSVTVGQGANALGLSLDFQPLGDCIEILRFVEALKPLPDVSYQFIEDSDA